MKTGISTASLFGRMNTEDALAFLSDNKVETAEVFLESFCEYNAEYGRILRGVNKNTEIHSVHVLTTQYEPQLYSIGDRAREDSFKILDSAMAAAEEFGAKYYTFHGIARYKKTPYVLDYDRIADITRKISETCNRHGVTLSYENVHWAYYNFIGFFTEVKKRFEKLKGVLDVKQARQSGIPYAEYIKEMGKDIVTVHLSDIDENGKMCMPGKGITDFYDLFTRLYDVGFDGAAILEVYKNDYKEYSELFDSLDYVNNVIAKIYK